MVKFHLVGIDLLLIEDRAEIFVSVVVVVVVVVDVDDDYNDDDDDDDDDDLKVEHFAAVDYYYSC